ncbi:MAG: hypothetical protein M0Z71_00895 [Nitrospiraceae bacterium]|nr:hypothetical protein [Nitrospiraceae bacterium]
MRKAGLKVVGKKESPPFAKMTAAEWDELDHILKRQCFMTEAVFDLWSNPEIHFSEDVKLGFQMIMYDIEKKFETTLKKIITPTNGETA